MLYLIAAILTQACFFNPPSPDPPKATTLGLVLVGDATATVAGQLDSVRTNLDREGGLMATTLLTTGDFTLKTLDAPIPVLAGQDVEITVEISFS